MSFPAFIALGRDPELSTARFRTYVHLVETPILSHVAPVEVKVRALVQSLHMGYTQACDALDWLVRRGYLKEHGRDARGTRSLSLVWTAPEPVPFPKREQSAST